MIQHKAQATTCCKLSKLHGCVLNPPSHMQPIGAVPPYLDMPLWLHESTHDTKAGKEVSRLSMGSHSWYDGVVGTFARGKGIRMRGV